MDLLDKLGGEDHLTLVMGASQVEFWKNSSDFWIKEYVSITYFESGIKYRVEVNECVYCITCDRMVYCEKYTLLPPRNIFSKLLSRDPDPVVTKMVNPRPDEIRVMVEELTGLSLNPF